MNDREFWLEIRRHLKGILVAICRRYEIDE